MARRASETAYERLRADIVDWRLPPGTMLAEVELSARLGVSRTPIREAIGRLVADGLAAPQGGRGVTVSSISLEDARHLFDVRVALDSRAAALAAGAADRSQFADLQRRLRAAADCLFTAALPATAPGSGHSALDGAAAAAVAVASTSGNVHVNLPAEADAYYALVAELDDAIDEAAGNAVLLDFQVRLRTQLARMRRLARDRPRRLAESALEHAAIAEAIAAGDADLASAATRVHLANALTGITAGMEDVDHASRAH